MKLSTVTACVGLGLALVLAGSSVSAHHSYLLTVQQLNAGLSRAATPATKGFFLIDVRSPQEHLTGVIPGTDRNIEYREIRARHHEIGARSDRHIVVYCHAGPRSDTTRERRG